MPCFLPLALAGGRKEGVSPLNTTHALSGAATGLAEHQEVITVAFVIHVVVRLSGRVSRVAVRRDGDMVGLVTVRGEALPASCLGLVLDAALGEGWRLEAEGLHRARCNPWRVDVRVGRSGARDYRLRYVADARYGIVRTGAAVHVSMYGKLNEGVVARMGDLAPILAIIEREDYPLDSEREEVEIIGVYRVDADNELLEQFMAPGEDI